MIFKRRLCHLLILFLNDDSVSGPMNEVGAIPSYPVHEVPGVMHVGNVVLFPAACDGLVHFLKHDSLIPFPHDHKIDESTIYDILAVQNTVCIFAESFNTSAAKKAFGSL